MIIILIEYEEGDSVADCALPLLGGGGEQVEEQEQGQEQEQIVHVRIDQLPWREESVRPSEQQAVSDDGRVGVSL